MKDSFEIDSSFTSLRRPNFLTDEPKEDNISYKRGIRDLFLNGVPAVLSLIATFIVETINITFIG